MGWDVLESNIIGLIVALKEIPPTPKTSMGPNSPQNGPQQNRMRAAEPQGSPNEGAPTSKSKCLNEYIYI